MALCNRCQSEAEYTTNGRTSTGERDESLPLGLDAGETCDRCGLSD